MIVWENLQENFVFMRVVIWEKKLIILCNVSSLLIETIDVRYAIVFLIRNILGLSKWILKKKHLLIICDSINKFSRKFWNSIAQHVLTKQHNFKESVGHERYWVFWYIRKSSMIKNKCMSFIISKRKQKYLMK